MNLYFKSRRRTLGVLTLTVACLCTVGWIRSMLVLDRYFYSQAQSMHAFFSMDGVLAWRKLTPFAEDLPAGWSERAKWIASPLTQQSLDNYKVYWNDGDVHWHWQTGGFDFGAISFEMLGKPPNPNWVRREEIWQIPYWSIVIPFIVLSAWLLLSKSSRHDSQPNQQQRG